MNNSKVITGKQLKDMLLGAYHSFEKNFEAINDLNVFPVPDGDTGTNMMHTMASVAKAISAMSDEAEAGEIGAAAARSAIMGARGNSGVILSQLLRGIGKGVAGKKTLNNTEIGKAFQFGILYAYRSVSKPVEGTILTVARGMAKGAYNAVRGNVSLEEVLLEAIRSGKEELARTPELLPALKAAGVVDAGGQGLIVFSRAVWQVCAVRIAKCCLLHRVPRYRFRRASRLIWNTLTAPNLSSRMLMLISRPSARPWRAWAIP